MENGIGSGKPGPGRPKGLANRTTRAAKDAIALAAEQLGGADRLVAWAQEDPANERVFWGTIYPKLLPLKMEGRLDGDFDVRHSGLNAIYGLSPAADRAADRDETGPV